MVIIYIILISMLVHMKAAYLPVVSSALHVHSNLPWGHPLILYDYDFYFRTLRNNLSLLICLTCPQHNNCLFSISSIRNVSMCPLSYMCLSIRLSNSVFLHHFLISCTSFLLYQMLFSSSVTSAPIYNSVLHKCLKYTLLCNTSSVHRLV